jgi:hypothetical protein
MDTNPVTELQRCLALVRPVGMSDDMARDWLTAAVAEVRNVPLGTLARACADVRKTATHHGQIIPAIMAATAEATKPDPFAWALACHNPTKPPALGHDGGAKRLGDVVKRLGYDQ